MHIDYRPLNEMAQATRSISFPITQPRLESIKKANISITYRIYSYAITLTRLTESRKAKSRE